MPARKKTPDPAPEPRMAAYAASERTKQVARAASNAKSTTLSRRNKSATIERQDRFTNIDNGLVPFQRSTGS